MALGMHEEGAQTVHASAHIRFVQVISSSTDVLELRISRELAEVPHERFCGCINTPAVRDCLCRLPLPPPAPEGISLISVSPPRKPGLWLWRCLVAIHVSSWKEVKSELAGLVVVWVAWRTWCFSWQVCFQCCINEEQTQALSQSVFMWTEMSGHMGSSPPFLSLLKFKIFEEPGVSWWLCWSHSEAVGNSGALPNALVTLVREGGEQWYHDTLLEADVSQFLLKISAHWGSWAVQYPFN